MSIEQEFGKRNFLREISNLAEQVKELPENEREESLLLINKAQVAIENIQDLSQSIGGNEYESICEKIFNDTSANIENRKIGEGYDQKIAA